MTVEVELDIFSGRPNPRWLLEPRFEAELFERIDSLALAPHSSFPEPPGLGYRGFSLRIENKGAEELVRVYGGTARVGDETKKDPSRALEKWLLETAVDVDKGLLDAIKGEL